MPRKKQQLKQPSLEDIVNEHLRLSQEMEKRSKEALERTKEHKKLIDELFDRTAQEKFQNIIQQIRENGLIKLANRIERIAKSKQIKTAPDLCKTCLFRNECKDLNKDNDNITAVWIIGTCKGFLHSERIKEITREPGAYSIAGKLHYSKMGEDEMNKQFNPQ